MVGRFTHPQDGRYGQCLSTRGLDVPRHRRAPVPRGVPPQGRFDSAITVYDDRSFGTQSPERKRESLPRPERMAQAAPAFGVSPAETRTSAPDTSISLEDNPTL